MRVLYGDSRLRLPKNPLLADEREVAVEVVLVASNDLTPSELELCLAALRPGAQPLDWRDRLRLSALAGRVLGGAAP